MEFCCRCNKLSKCLRYNNQYFCNKCVPSIENLLDNLINSWYFWKENKTGGRIFRNYRVLGAFAVYQNEAIHLYNKIGEKPFKEILCNTEPLEILNALWEDNVKKWCICKIC